MLTEKVQYRDSTPERMGRVSEPRDTQMREMEQQRQQQLQYMNQRTPTKVVIDADKLPNQNLPIVNRLQQPMSIRVGGQHQLTLLPGYSATHAGAVGGTPFTSWSINRNTR